MSRFKNILSTMLGVSLLFLAGCRQHESEHEHEHAHEHGDHPHDGHNHAPETASGARFEPGKGIVLGAETRRSLKVETGEVSERTLPFAVRFPAQVFGEDHKPATSETYHAECTARAAGLISQAQAAHVRPGETVTLITRSEEPLAGVVLGLSRALAIGDVEVLIGITNSGARLKSGDFVSATIVPRRDRPVPAVPASAVLRSAEGSFVYLANEEAYRRTPVKTGAAAGDFIEITDGVRVGDKIVTQPVEKLWLIELRATRGGGHSH